jgi:hypothetical protein
VSRFTIQSITVSKSGLWAVTFIKEGWPHPQFRFYGPKYELKDELDVYKCFMEETKYD